MDICMNISEHETSPEEKVPAHREVSAVELATELGISSSSVYSYAYNHLIPHYYRGSKIKFDLEDARKAFESRHCRPREAASLPGGQGANPPERRPKMGEPGYIERRGRKPDPMVRRFNTALHRIVREETLQVGDIAAQLAIVTGLPIEDIRRRADVVEFEYSDAEKTGEPDGSFTKDEWRYVATKYSRSTDPAVKRWLDSIRRTH